MDCVCDATRGELEESCWKCGRSAWEIDEMMVDRNGSDIQFNYFFLNNFKYLNFSKIRDRKRVGRYEKRKAVF